jgi:hypothetical protein
MDGLLGIVALAVLVAIYAAPTIVANVRGHRNKGSIIATNILLGWTFIGWCVALIWALSANAEKPPPTDKSANQLGARQNWE